MNAKTKTHNDSDLPELVTRLISGDHSAFKSIYRLFFSRVFHFVNRFSVTREETEEIVQDVFVKLWENRSSLNTDKNICNYLYKISKNQVIDRIRKNIAVSRHFDNFERKHPKVLTSNTTEQLVNFYELTNIISGLVEELPIKRRAIFKLNREKGLTYKEISDVLKISQGTVEKQMSKALHSLTSSLRNRYGIFIDL
ncbi:MAG: RNA polymerase sigma-70 factor [Cytophagales bacterium]|nr:RNA polymerase sigma-70 factor [Cytophagales bacterium]